MSNIYCANCDWLTIENDRLTRDLAAALRERDEAMKDAERYRWLRDNDCSVLRFTTSGGDKYDAAIDAARAQGGSDE